LARGLLAGYGKQCGEEGVSSLIEGLVYSPKSSKEENPCNAEETKEVVAGIPKLQAPTNNATSRN